MALAATLVRQDEGEQRGADRVAVDIGATLRDGSAGPIDATIHDLSMSGFLAETSADLAVNALFRVGLSGLGPNSARVVWRDGNLYGCAFTRQLTLADVGNALTAAPVTAVNFGGAAPGEAVDEAAPPVHRINRRDMMLIVGASAALWAGVWKMCATLLA